ncbi:cytochrome c oxidase subunit NDUFA4-like [Oppia nitens]|uniref:cytochrome c oxidase subunit NDUFA4-like n=1 Tax=Oppia nitens TaxID=1686743 RepID=UPI0023DC5BCF|nr:cytochrome c oxidase subunit NDUFA4-like [Oppia nitens]
MKSMPSLSMTGLRKNPSLIPLLFFVGAGGVWAGYYIGRLAFRNPDVTWNRKTNPEPWQAYDKKQYKFWSEIDHNTYEHPRPKF